MRMFREMLRRRIGWTHTGAAALILMAATFQLEPDERPANPSLSSVTDNAMTFNAMTFNALMLHPTEQFADYSLNQVVAPGSVFEQALQKDPYSHEFMQYLVSCALEENDSVTWASGNMSWGGSLGLCPAWKTGAPSEECQELVSACLLARTNAYGQSVPISLRGRYIGDDTDNDPTNDIDGDPLPLTVEEKADFEWQEGAFFGNIFCDDCVDPSLEMFVLNGLLHYRRRSLTNPSAYTDVACDSFERRRPGEVRRLREACHQRFLLDTSYQGVVYRAMFACWSPVWADGKAYTMKRICAGAASTGGVVQDQKQCAAWAVGACTVPSEMVPCQTDDICAVDDTAAQPEDWDVDDCTAMPMPSHQLPEPGTCPAAPPLTAPTWHHPLTVFLDEPCSVVPQPSACYVNFAIIDPGTNVPIMPYPAPQAPQ